MIIKQSVTKTITEDKVVDMFCNKCGRSLRKVMAHGPDGDEYTFHGLKEVTVYGGYASPLFGDGDWYKFSLCEFCLDELFNIFKHPANQYIYGSDWPEEWAVNPDEDEDL